MFADGWYADGHKLNAALITGGRNTIISSPRVNNTGTIKSGALLSIQANIIINGPTGAIETAAPRLPNGTIDLAAYATGGSVDADGYGLTGSHTGGASIAGGKFGGGAGGALNGYGVGAPGATGGRLGQGTEFTPGARGRSLGRGAGFAPGAGGALGGYGVGGYGVAGGGLGQGEQFAPGAGGALGGYGVGAYDVDGSGLGQGPELGLGGRRAGGPLGGYGFKYGVPGGGLGQNGFGLKDDGIGGAGVADARRSGGSVDFALSGFDDPNPARVGNTTYRHASPFAEDAEEGGPGAILDRVGDARSRQGVTAFADPTLERSLIRQALLDQTGDTILDQRYRNPVEQQQALHQGTVDFLQANPDIHLGQSLSDAQKSRLTAPILWYEERTIDGQRTLTPQLMLPPGRLAEWTKNAGGRIQGGDVFLSGDQITNTGSLLASGSMVIDAGTFINERRVASSGSGVLAQNVLQPGGVVSANDLHIFTQGDLINRGGTLLAHEDLTLVAGGNILITAQAVTNSSLMGSRNHWIATDSTVNHAALVAAGGDLTMVAGGSLSVLGSTVTAGGDALLAARGPITIASVLDTVSTTTFSRKDALLSSSRTLTNQSSQTNVASVVAAGGDLTVVSGSDLTVKASHLVAGGDLGLRATGSVSILAGEDAHQALFAKRSSGFGLFGGNDGLDLYRSKRTSGTVTTVDNAASTVVAGRNASIVAGQDVNVVGSVIMAGHDLALTAGRDVNITPGAASRTVTTQNRRSGFGIQASLGNDSVSVGVGLRTSTDRTVRADNDNVPSVLAAGRDLHIVAGRDITLQAAQVSTERDLRLKAGRDINLLAAQDSSTTVSRHDRFFAGISATLSSPLIGAGQNLANAATGLGGRNGAESIAPTALAAYKTVQALGKGSTGSLTAGFEHESSRVIHSSSTPVVTSLRSGGSTTIVAEKGSITGVGFQIAAGVDAQGRPTGNPGAGTVRLQAGRDIFLESAQATIQILFGSRSTQAAIGVGADGGPAASAGYSRDTGRSSEVHQVNSHVSGTGTVSLISGGDTSLRGAVVSGPQIVAHVGGNLTIESRPDTARYRENTRQAQGRIGGGNVSGGVNSGRVQADSTNVSVQSGLKAGDGGYQITVGGGVDLKGGMIISTADRSRNSLSTDHL